MAFRSSSNWNEKSELEALLIFKQLEHEGFPRARQSELCRKMSKKYDLSKGNISAKVGNYKSEASINNTSNSSKETIKAYVKYKNFSISELKNIIDNIQE